MNDTRQPPAQHSPTNERAELSTPQRPTWALVIGIIAIVIASMGIVTYGLCTPAGTIVTGITAGQVGNVTDKTPELAPTAAQMRVTWEYAPWTITNGCMIAVLGVLLLVGGIGLVRMRCWARAVLLWWAGLRLAALVPGSVLGWMVQRATFDAMAQAQQTSGGSSPGASFFTMFNSPVFAVVTVALGALLVLILPVFTLWWFNRRSIRQSMAGWPRRNSNT